MVWVIVIGIIAYIFIKFFVSLNKDMDDLHGQTLDKKFEVVVAMLNEAAFAGRGDTYNLDRREFNLYEEGQNQIIKFLYSTGHLSITWRYKYFQKEIVHARQFNNVRNISIFEQQKIAEQMINEMIVVVERHKENVLKDFYM